MQVLLGTEFQNSLWGEIRRTLKYLGVLVIIGVLYACNSVSADGHRNTESTAQPAEASTPIHLRTESQLNPISVGRQNPRLSWRSQVNGQAAYEIEVASSKDALIAGDSDLWSSGKVVDGRSVAIPYTGVPLSSRQTAFWRVRIWSAGSDRAGPWSKPSSWQMGLLEEADWTASWITSASTSPFPSAPGFERWLSATAADPQFTDETKIADTKRRLREIPPATYFRKDFKVNQPVESARLYSTSAGYSEFYLSGEKIGDRIFNPAQTDFDKRIYYDVDDVTDRLSVGTHALALHLGNGFYGERTAFGRDDLFYGEPAAIAQLEINYRDGSREVITSDESWKTHPSPIVKNGVYSGEVYDARETVTGWSGPNPLKASKWQQVAVLEKAPTDVLVAAEMPPVRRVTEVTPIALLNPAEGVWVVDFGQNFTGVPTIEFSRIDLNNGQTVLLRYAEWADPNGNISLKSGGRAPRTKQVDAYIANGVDDRTWSPTFTWHGFRYMEITGLEKAPPIEAFTAHLTRTDVPRIGQFTSSSALLNRIHETALWSFEANLVSVPSDCPIRERNGWTGDAHATIRMAAYNFNMAPFLEKYLGDFKTTEMIAPTIVPGRRTRSGKIDWAAAEVLLTWEHYLHSGDISVIEHQYESLLEYVAFVESVAIRNLFTNPDHFYGDWCDTLPELAMSRPLGRCRSYSTPAEITTSALMFRVFDLMAKMASRTGKTEDSKKFSIRRDAIGTDFNTAYFDKTTGSYGSQTANSMALQFGIVPKDLTDTVAASLDVDVREKWDGHASVGALGQTWLYPALSDFGYTDTAFGVFTAEGPPGYSYLFDTLNGTTIWEDITQYDPTELSPPGKSLNHPFHGGYDAWFYSGLGGINPDPTQPGYKHFHLRPVFPSDLDWVKVSLASGYGEIRSDWTRLDDRILWQVVIPPNTTASLTLGAGLSPARTLKPGEHTFYLTVEGDREIAASQ